MFVPGAMAATSEARVMSAPAEAARAPLGYTYTITGTLAPIIFWMIVRIASSRPPGVSSRMITAALFVSMASSMPDTRYCATGGVMASLTSRTITSAARERLGARRATTAQANHAARASIPART